MPDAQPRPAPATRLPVPLWPFGPYQALSLRVHELTVHGRNCEALALADRLEHVVDLLGDTRSVGMIRQGRLYALISLGRLHEALDEGERLLQMHRTSGARTGEAKILADTAEILIKLGLLDEGLHRLANATRLLESIPRGNVRYISAMSSVSEAARAAELYELALLAAAEQPGDSTGALLNAVRAHARHLWRLRLERRSMLQQARRRVDLEAARASADRDAAQDALTGLGNRRQFDRQLDQIGDPAGSAVLLLVDIDRFKGINDHFSHIVGDRVLREIAAILRAHCRPEDVAVRLGGDEFALFLHTDLPAAARVGERIRDVVTARDWDQVAAGLRVTLSIGVAAAGHGMDGRQLYDLADRNLYVAKRSGRDRVAA